MEQQELIVAKPNGGAIQRSLTPMELLQTAIEKGIDTDQLRQLMDLQERHEKGEAKKAFDAAMAAFKEEPIVVTKDKTNGQYNSKYTSIGNLVDTVTPFLSKHGLSAGWEIDQTSGIKVSCILTHKAGHSKSVSMVVPPDKSGSKNPLQEIKSAITYAKVCTFESACGLASVDGNVDDDGNGSGNKVEADWLKERLEWIANSRNESEVVKMFQDAYKVAQGKKDTDAMGTLIAAKNKRKKELQ